MTYYNMAPSIVRQRLLIEGYWSEQVDEPFIHQFMLDLPHHLGLRAYGEPAVYSPESGMGRDANSGWDAFVPLVDSGIAAYFWAEPKFFSVVIYTCKTFDGDAAVSFVRERLGVGGEIARLEF